MNAKVAVSTRIDSDKRDKIQAHVERHNEAHNLVGKKDALSISAVLAPIVDKTAEIIGDSLTPIVVVKEHIDSETNNLKLEIDSLKSQVDEWKEVARKHKASVSTLQDEIDEKDDKISSMERSLDKASSNIRELDDKNDLLKSDNEELLKALNSTTNKFKVSVVLLVIMFIITTYLGFVKF